MYGAVLAAYLSWPNQGVDKTTQARQIEKHNEFDEYEQVSVSKPGNEIKCYNFKD